MSTRCTGHCCRSFDLPYSPAELMAKKAAHDALIDAAERRGDTRAANERREADIYKVSRMVVFQGWKEPYDQPRTTHHDGSPRKGGYFYTCKHHDPVTGDCRNYADRPRMCYEFPYGHACPYDDCQAPHHGRTTGCGPNATPMERELARAGHPHPALPVIRSR